MLEYHIIVEERGKYPSDGISSKRIVDISLDESDYRTIKNLIFSSDLTKKEKVEEIKEYECADCGAAMNEGEAKTFTCCDACWDKKYKEDTPREWMVTVIDGQLYRQGTKAASPHSKVEHIKVRAV